MGRDAWRLAARHRSMTTIARCGDPHTGRSETGSVPSHEIPERITAAKIAQPIKAFWGDTHGIILPYVTMMLVVIVGVSVLALDGSRYMSLQTQLQNGADALALAGAAELDRLPDSEDRAGPGLRTLVATSTLFGAGPSRNGQAVNIRFFSQIPATDDAPESAGIPAGDPTSARFVSVTVKPVSLATILSASLFGGSKQS